MVEVISRAEFIEDRWNYRKGESIGILGPTGFGKSMLAYQLADESLKQNPGMSFVSHLPKPSDETSYQAADNLGLQVTHRWPPQKKLFSPKPRGYVFHPPHVTESAEADIEYVSGQMKNALNKIYWKGNVLTFVDDAFLVEARYKAAAEVEQYLVAGRSNQAGVMYSLQAPKGSVRSGVSSFHYSQPTHLFFGREDIESNRERYAEISMGIDPRLIDGIVKNLKTYQVTNGNASEFLYLDRRGPYACIVQPW
jgi:hypothetical protein